VCSECSQAVKIGSYILEIFRELGWINRGTDGTFSVNLSFAAHMVRVIAVLHDVNAIWKYPAIHSDSDAERLVSIELLRNDAAFNVLSLINDGEHPSVAQITWPGGCISRNRGKSGGRGPVVEAWEEGEMFKEKPVRKRRWLNVMTSEFNPQRSGGRPCAAGQIPHPRRAGLKPERREFGMTIGVAELVWVSQEGFFGGGPSPAGRFWKAAAKGIYWRAGARASGRVVKNQCFAHPRLTTWAE
jgi:hypothetical protein